MGEACVDGVGVQVRVCVRNKKEGKTKRRVTRVNHIILVSAGLGCGPFAVSYCKNLGKESANSP